jgi:hypothetical protein
MRCLQATTLIAALAIAACSAAPVQRTILPPSTPGNAPIATPPTTPSAVATATDATPAGGVIQLEYGCQGVGRCEDLPAGTYETSGKFAFLPGLTLTLPEGWSAGEQDAGEFELSQSSDPDPRIQISEILFWSDVVPWVEGRARLDLGATADELADYLLADERLVVTEAPSRTFGVRGPDDLRPVSSVKARSLSVIVSDSAHTERVHASECPAEACINLLQDPDHWPGTFELLRNTPADDPLCPRCSRAVRFYIADIGSDQDPHTLVIALSTFGLDALESLSDWETQVEPIIASVLVPYIVVNN